VNELLREAGGAIKIEDILPLFPDFAQVRGCIKARRWRITCHLTRFCMHAEIGG
jgi:hypothetical protein